MRPIKSRSAVLWVAAGLLYFVAEGISAIAFPGYSYATNYISDLGVPDVAVFQGRPIDSPLHVVMNTAFVLHGILFVAAAVATTRGNAWSTRARRWFVGMALTHGVGIALVGIFHGSQANLENGLIGLHVIGAAMAIVAGNVAAIIAGSTALRSGPRWIGPASIMLGVIGLVGLVMLQVDSASTTVDILPDGVWERVAVYAILAWELMVGISALAINTQKRRRHA
ncbi:DUF998 domain-containing protein [Microbacterium arborescens]|uniref:DUF998 domain-containing protein n=1 Tax=Microbacterium arborescens TaxID=33883 RepID=UPI0027D8F953|nr:DUF998 domain-containing protein [Microbacterium arborescens]